MNDFEKSKKELENLDAEIKSIETDSVHILKRIFNVTSKQDKIINEILKPNLCPYCKDNYTDSIDSNVLCPECRKMFGHSFFNEL